MAFPPDVYLIGAQKAGTTTLAFMLDQHPGISVSEPKEPHFFTRDWALGPDRYRACFPASEDTLFVDASTSYSSLPVPFPPAAPARSDDPRGHVVSRIRDMRPDARFIYMVRDPVARTYSSYWHHVRVGDEKRAFRAAIMENSFYLRSSYYAAQLRGYLEAFPLSAFHVVSFEDFRDDPAAIAGSCFRFLGLDPIAFTEGQEEAKNVSFTYSKGMKILGNLVGGSRGLERVLHLGKTLTPKWLRPLAAKLVTNPVPRLGDEDRAFLVDVFRDRNRELETLLDRTFPRWQGR